MGERTWTGRQQSKALTAWHDAVRKADLEKVRELLTAGQDVNALDERGETALMNAVHWNNFELAKVLIERGADLNRTAKHRLSALYLAVINHRTDFVKLLVQSGADTGLKGSGEEYGRTALEYAQAKGGRTEIVQILRKAT